MTTATNYFKRSFCGASQTSELVGQALFKSAFTDKSDGSAERTPLVEGSPKSNKLRSKKKKNVSNYTRDSYSSLRIKSPMTVSRLPIKNYQQ